MKKLLTLIFGLALLGGAAAAQTVQYGVDVEPFSGIDVSGPFEVSLVRGHQYRVLITVLEPYKDYVECYVGAGTLKLDLEERKVPAEIRRQFRGKGTPDPVYSAIVYVPDLLQSVSLSGKAVLHDTEDVFDKARVSFELSESSNIKPLQFSSLVVNLDLEGKASADLSITCRELVVEMSNSTNLKVKDTSEEVYYTLQGGAKVRAEESTQSFNVKTKANCNMNVTGTSSSASFDMAGTSEVDASRLEVSDATVSMSSVCKLSVFARDNLKVKLNGGSTLYFAGEPNVLIDNIRSATMSRLAGYGGSTRL